MASPEDHSAQRAGSLSSQSGNEKLDHSKDKNLEGGHAGGVSAVHQDAGSDVFASLVEGEAAHDIKLRTMSWQKTAVLLFGEYVCLAIMAQGWSYSILGYFPGLLVTLCMGLITLYTSYVLWQFTMQQTAKGERCLDICDLGYLLFGKSRLAYEMTAIMLLLNNIFLMGFHILTGARILNTLSDGGLCTTVFSVIITVASIICSIPRTLNHVALMSWGSAICMAIAILLCMIFAGIESNPAYGYAGAWPIAGPVFSRAFAEKGTTFVAGTNAFLNITFLWIGQILYPTFIAEMERPQDFPKALYALTVAEFILFAVPAVVMYRYLGQYTTAPAFGSLQPTYKKISFAFVIVPTIVIGVIYANVAAKYVFSRVMRGSRHAHSHSIIGWGSWIGIMIVCWFLAFVIGSVIPSFGDFLSIMSAAFDSWFGGIFWVVGYWRLNRGSLWSSPLKILTSVFNIIILGISLFMFGPGLYTSVQAIVDDYAGPVKHPFSCTSNAL